MGIIKLPVRVLIVEFSPDARAALRRYLEQDPAIQVAGAADGAEQAVEMAGRLMPDVILIGDRPPRADALPTVRHIMHVKPVPVVVVAAATAAGDGIRAFGLMEAGALAVVREPSELAASQQAGAIAHLLQTTSLMSEVKVVRRWHKPAAAAASVPEPHPQPLRPAGRRRVDLVAIGASTGGPVVLKTILSSLPRSFPVPILIVQHISTGFVDGLAEWLSASGVIPTRMAVTGQPLKPGHAYLAPDGVHMRLASNGSLAFDGEPPMNGHRPAISRLFRSVALHSREHAVGILLTGMGVDGAAELKMMKDAGAITIAQDSASSVVHGMPGEAIRCGATTHVMSPQQIAAALPGLVA